MKHFATILFLIVINYSFGQSSQPIAFNKELPDVSVNKTSDLTYKLNLSKGGVYQVTVLQKGIDVALQLKDKTNKQLVEKDSPNGQNGYEKFEYIPAEGGDYFLTIKRLEDSGNPDSGKVSVLIKKLSKNELREREVIRKELEPENKKNVQTLDIDHFWQAFDNLKNSKTHSDSVASFQKLYLDRATDGLIDFIQARDFTAEKFVEEVSRFSKFYSSVRPNTYEVKKAEPLIEEVFAKFSELYPNFKPFKVCFAIGLVNTGGTVSGKFVLIGSEVTTSTKSVDLSEFNGSAFSKVLEGETDVVQKIRNIVSHECVHTQQKSDIDSNAFNCQLLTSVLGEGVCDFIGELVAGGQINKIAQEYGKAHEKQLWTEFKSEMCSNRYNNWLYNYSTVKNKPADLGYYMGYEIAKSYYENAADKKQAIIDIIEMDDPMKFLVLSKYDKKPKR